MQQRQLVFDAPSSNQQIDGLADGNPAPAQGAKVAGSGDGDCISGHGYDFESAQERFNLPSRPLAIETLQHLAKHQISDDDLIPAKGRVQRRDVR